MRSTWKHINLRTEYKNCSITDHRYLTPGHERIINSSVDINGLWTADRSYLHDVESFWSWCVVILQTVLGDYYLKENHHQSSIIYHQTWFVCFCRRTRTCAAMSVTRPALTCLTLLSWWETGRGGGSSPTGRQLHGPGILSPCWPTSLCPGTRVWRWSMILSSPSSTADQPAWCWRNLWTKVIDLWGSFSRTPAGTNMSSVSDIWSDQ